MKIPGRIFIGILFAGVLVSWLIYPAFSSSSVAPNVLSQQQAITSDEGAALYKERCAVCHDTPQDRVPPLFLIKRRSAEDVIQTLTTGVMKQQAAGLNADQIRALAIYLTGKQPSATVKTNFNANLCTGNT